MANLLIIDDNKAALTALELLFIDDFQKVILLEDPGKNLSVLHRDKVDVILLDMNFTSNAKNGKEGIFWLKKIKEVQPEIPVVMITAFGEIELAVESMKVGAFDFILKPWKNDKVKEVINKAVTSILLRRGAGQNTSLKHNYQNLIGCSQVILDLKKTLKKVAATQVNILLIGEEGTGKKLIAYEIHKLSQTSNKPVYLLNNEELIKGEQFNAESTLILERVDTIDLKTQEQIFHKLQENNLIKRIISTTHFNIEDIMKEGLFRMDLFYELSTVQISIPPLRQRGNDVILLAQYFLAKFQKQYNKAGLEFSEEAKKILLEYSWPGNVTELAHVIERSVILTDNASILKSDIKFTPQHPTSFFTDPFSLEDMEKKLIHSALKRLNGNLSAVASELGVSRQTLYNKMKKYDI